MAQKLKFKPVIIRIRLNPEQAVLQCSCYHRGKIGVPGGGRRQVSFGRGRWCTGIKGKMRRTARRGGTWGRTASAAVS